MAATKVKKADLKQALARGRSTYAEWGMGLTLEQFLERERRFRESPWAQGAISTWLLEDEKGTCLSSCEAFFADSEFRGKKGISCGVASVYTEPAARKKGHAKALLEEVEREALKLHPTLQAFFLFSDIGAHYYEALGYKARPAWDRVFDPDEGNPFEEASEASFPGALEGLKWPPSPFQILPTPGFVGWQLAREKAYSEFLERRRPAAQGAKIGSSVLIWSVNYRKDELFALVFAAEGPTEARMLIRAGRRQAHALGLKRFRAWEEHASFPWPQGPEGGRREARDGSLPMLNPRLPGLTAQDWLRVPRAAWI